MSDQPGGLWRARKLGATADADAPGGNRPLVLVILIGLALAIVPIISFFLPSQFLRDAAENALPLVVGCIVLAILVMQQPNLVTVGGGFLLIGFAAGVGLAFAPGESASYTDAGLAILG